MDKRNQPPLRDWDDLYKGTRGLALHVDGHPPFPIRRAPTFFSRFFGLMGRPVTPYGLWLSPCDAIHMMFMRFSLDAVFLDRSGLIVSVRTGVKPWGFAFGGKGAHSVIELPTSAGLARGLIPGMPIPLKSEG